MTIQRHKRPDTIAKDTTTASFELLPIDPLIISSTFPENPDPAKKEIVQLVTTVKEAQLLSCINNSSFFETVRIQNVFLLVVDYNVWYGSHWDN